MMRAIVFATIVSMLIMEATSWRESLGEREESELPKQIAEILKEWSPKYALLMRQSRSSSKCPDGPDCFVALMGKRSMKKRAMGRSDSHKAKFLQDLQNYNLTPQYVE